MGAMGKRLTIILAVLAAMPLLYVGSYLLLVKAERPFNVALSGPGPFPIRKPTYRLGGSFAATVFAPLHATDKQVRPQYWSYSYDLEGILTP
jgi:hypothetical protein